MQAGAGVMHLAVPLSDVFRRRQEALLPLVDAVSFKAPDTGVFAGKKQFLETSTGIADPRLPERLAEEGYLDAMASGRFCSLACDLGPAWTEVGLAKSVAGFPRYAPVAEPLDESSYLRRAERNVVFLRERFGGSLKVENLNYFPTGAYQMVCEPPFITRIIDRLGLELLLDISHAIISAVNLRVPVARYVEALPLARVTELHVSGVRLVDGVLEDAHDLPGAREYALVEQVERVSAVRHLTIEHYRDECALLEEYRRLAALGGGAAQEGAHACP